MVGRPGSLIEENNEYVQGEEQADEDLVGIGVCLNVTNKGEVVVVGLLAGHAAHVGGVEVGDIIFAVDHSPLWRPQVVFLYRLSFLPLSPASIASIASLARVACLASTFPCSPSSWHCSMCGVQEACKRRARGVPCVKQGPRKQEAPDARCQHTLSKITRPFTADRGLTADRGGMTPERGGMTR